MGRLNTTGDTTVSMQEDSDEQQEVIEVQILPQVRNRETFNINLGMENEIALNDFAPKWQLTFYNI
jgi:hypothetical protein